MQVLKFKMSPTTITHRHTHALPIHSYKINMLRLLFSASVSLCLPVDGDIDVVRPVICWPKVMLLLVSLPLGGTGCAETKQISHEWTPEHGELHLNYSLPLTLSFLTYSCWCVCTESFSHSVSDQSQAERSNAIAVAGAVMGAVLALFLIAIFLIVILTARKAPAPALTDKV